MYLEKRLELMEKCVSSKKSAAENVSALSSLPNSDNFKLSSEFIKILKFHLDFKEGTTQVP
jgi:hypothetical protein